MRVLTSTALFLALSAAAVPAFAQNGPASTSGSATAADPASASLDYVALKDGLMNQNKALTSDVSMQRAIVKRNQDLLKEAQKLDAANKKLISEKQKLNEENANLEKQRAALAASQGDSSVTK
jgi:hypothetical protein